MSELDPVDQLEDTKIAISKKIAAAKILLSAENRKLRSIEKANVEIVTDKAQKILDQTAVITKLTDSLAELEIDLKDLSRTRDDENEEKIQGALNAVALQWLKDNPSAGYIIGDEKFIYVENYSSSKEKMNVLVRELDPKVFCEELGNSLKIPSWHLPPQRLKHLFSEMDKSFNLSRYTIDPKRWNHKVYSPIKNMVDFFIDKDVGEEGEQHSRYFDVLMYSLSGGKKENQDHIEQWILHKIINYDKSVSTPDMVLVGHVGGNGKGIIQGIIRQMIPTCLSGRANTKTMNGNFNAIMLGKLVVFYDDQNSKEILLEKVKEIAGADSFIVELKGRDQYEAENTHNSAWFCNILPFPLSPAGQEGGVDRRFSIMRTSITFLESLIRDRKEQGFETTMEEAKDIAEFVVSTILLNRVEIGKWFRHLLKKHPVDKNFTLKPLHGEDYHYFLERQQSSYDVIWRDLVGPLLKEGKLTPIFVIKELIRHMDGRVVGDKTIVGKMKDLAAQYREEVSFERIYIDISPRSSDKKKQCAVIQRTKSTDNTFDWSLVSNADFCSVARNENLIEEDNLVFGVKANSDDEDVLE